MANGFRNGQVISFPNSTKSLGDYLTDLGYDPSTMKCFDLQDESEVGMSTACCDLPDTVRLEVVNAKGNGGPWTVTFLSRGVPTPITVREGSTLESAADEAGFMTSAYAPQVFTETGVVDSDWSSTVMSNMTVRLEIRNAKGNA